MTDFVNSSAQATDEAAVEGAQGAASGIPQMETALVGSTAISAELRNSIQAGTMGYTYRGRPTWKCPFDVAIYMQLLWALKPASIIEFGSNRGGSALMLADQLANYELTSTHIYSYDIVPVTDLEHPMITFGYADLADPSAHLDAAMLKNLPKPLLVIDDASHQSSHVLATLRFIDQCLEAGDYVIVEDGILTHLGWDDDYAGGPLAALKTFLSETGGRYEIDRERCDTFGTNATWNVDGYIRRVA